MRIPQNESVILKHAFCKLHDAYHNIQCLYSFLKKEYPEKATIEYTVLLNGFLRMQEIEFFMGVSLHYPVFGKELDMVDLDKLKILLKEHLGLYCYGYLDLDDPVKDTCVDSDLHLYEIRFN